MRERSGREGVAIAELVRRAIDRYLVWDDPTYAPLLRAAKQGTAIHPRRNDGAFWLAFCNDNIVDRSGRKKA